MPNAPFDREALRYLLGEMSEEERAQFEASLLEGDDRVEALSAIEDDLLDRAARGELAENEAAYANSPRLAFAKRFTKAMDRANVSRPARRWARPVLLAIAACLLVFLLLRPRPPEVIPPIASNQPQPESRPEQPEIKPVMLALAMSHTRAAQAVKLSIPPDAKQVQIEIDLEGERLLPAYSARLLDAHGAVLFAAPRVLADAKASLLRLELPASAFPAGIERLEISPPGTTQQLGAFSIAVVRP